MLRRVAFTAALAALLAPAGVAEAKKTPPKPVVTSVKPMQARVGDTITIQGRNFIKGKAKNTVAFRRDGGKTVFVKADVSTLKQIRVVLPATLTPLLQNGDFTQFRIRVLARRFGKSFTPVAKSPKIGPALIKPGDATEAGAGGATGGGSAPAAPVVKPGDCDEDKILDKDEADDDDDLLSDALEADLMTDPCSKDSDADGVEDGYEYKSAIDLNDDEYQQPNTALPYPGSRPYPNPLSDDAGRDHDGDGLSLATEYGLWKYTFEKAKTGTRTLFPLTYSDGLQYSVHGVCQASGNPAGSPCAADPDSAGRRYPTLKVENYERWFGAAGFYTWLKGNGYEYVVLGWEPDEAPFSSGQRFHILDVNLSGTLSDGGFTTAGIPDYPDSEGAEYPGNELYAFGDGSLYLSDEERDEDADGLTNFTELRGSGRPGYWSKCYGTEQFDATGFPDAPLSAFNPDSDGDGVRDGADDLDHDDVPNIMELSRMKASGFDDTEDGSVPPVLAEGEASPPPSVGGGPLCKLDKELPPKGQEGEPDPMWHGPATSAARVQPFNPCLPNPESRTCPRVLDMDGTVPSPLNESPRNWQWFSLQ
jgi:hypothetical protein